MKLIQQLITKGFIDKKQVISLELEMKSSGKKFEEVVLERQLVSEEVLFKIKSEILKMPLKEFFAFDTLLEVLSLISEETASHYQIISIEKKANLVKIGMVYPEDLKAQEALKFASRQGKFSYQIFLITPTTFNDFLKQYRTLKGEVGQVLEKLDIKPDTEGVGDKFRTAAEFERLAEEAPIVRVVAVFLRHAVEGQSSDIHIEPTRDKLRIRFRFLGKLHASIFLPLKVHLAIIARIKILSNLKIDENRKPQDGRFSAKINNQDIDFRVSTLPTVFGEKVCIRVLDPSAGVKKLEELGLEKRSLELIKSAIKKPYGMILVTGPTGSGKTTTLYAILSTLNREDVNIITLEDPVEYFIAGVNQSQIKPEIDYGFATGLRHILRQDPDVIMVGEIRDEETANLAIHAGLTGHIVLSTLHTNNVFGVIPRLVDLNVKRYLISPTLNVAIAQRLVRKLCPFCKRKVEPKKETKDLILREIDNLPVQAKETINSSSFFIWEAVGCKKCNNLGFSDRLAIFEVFSMTDQFSEIILEEFSEAKVIEEAKRQGMLTMKQDGILKILAGKTTLEEVLRVAEEK